MKTLLKLLVAFAFLIFWSHFAYAQTTGVIPVAPVSVLAGIGMVLGLVLGYVNRGVATGTILVFKVPPVWLSYLSMLAVFLTAFIPQFVAMPTVTGAGLFLAFFAGVSALVSYSAGDTLRDHHETSSATAKRLIANTAKTIAVLCLFGSLIFGTQACTKAQVAEAGVIAQDVLSGLEHGQTLEQIELQVAQDAGFGGVVNTIVVTLVVDALDTLQALGLIPPNLLPTAAAMETKEADKLVKMGGKAAHALRAIPMPAGLLVAVAQ